MSNATFPRELACPLTYANLTTHYLGYSNILRSTLISVISPHAVAQAERVLEVLLIGIRLCQGRIGSAEEINTLVDRRIDDIQNERTPFIPDPFAEYQKKRKIEGEGYGQSEKEEREDIDDEQDDDEDLPNHSPWPSAPRNVSLVSSSSSPYSQDPVTGYPQAPIYSFSPSLSPASATRSPSSSSNNNDLWSELVTSLNETLYGYISIYSHTTRRYSDYQPTINLLLHALRIARQQPDDIHPDDVWDELEEAMLKIREAREADEDDEEMRP
jgi:hypothetical protein